MFDELEGEWTQVEHKRKQCQKVDNGRHAVEHRTISIRRHVKSLETTGTETGTLIEAKDTKHEEKPAVTERSVQSLIGKPVIRYDTSADSHPAKLRTLTKHDEETHTIDDKPRKGGLLYVRFNDAMLHNSSISMRKPFDSQNESWPRLENASSEELSEIPSPDIVAWSNVVKAPPKPRPFPIKKEEAVSSEKEELHTDNEETGKKKKKKKNKEKLSEPQTLDLGALIEALKSSKSPRKGSHTPVTKGAPVSKIKKLDNVVAPRNVLDSSAPATRRGKEREAPKKKKLTQMRKTIIKERQERKKLIEEGQPIPSILDVQQPPVQAIIPQGLHNRKFRDYCTHLVTPEINSTVESLLSDLVRFQDRVYKNEPLKLKTKRRYVCGLREVVKHLELKKMKCAIIPPNLDKIKSPGGINQTVERVTQLCTEQGIPVVYALSRRQLAYVLKKKFHIGCVGIISYAGAEDKFKKITDLVATATRDYKRKKEALSNPTASEKKVSGATVAVKPKPSNSNEILEVAVHSSLSEEAATESEDECHDECFDEMHDEDEVHVSEWKELFPEQLITTIPESHPPPPKTDFSWNVSAPTFVPKHF